MILVTGASGQLGYDVIKELEKRNIEHIGTTRRELDITDEDSVNKYILKLKPDCIIHCAAYTAVDKAEVEEELCREINVCGTENIAKACKDVNAKMIYISTDYVFDGTGNNPFEVDDKVNPLNIYGKTKYEGEIIIKKYLRKYFIVRTSWVFGINGDNFVKTILRLGNEKEKINVVCDQIGSPTYTADLATVLCDMLSSNKYGVYHVTNEGYCSWAEFAEEIIEQSGENCRINYVLTKEYSDKVIRPLNSRLSKTFLIKNGFKILPKWKEGLSEYIKVLKHYD